MRTYKIKITDSFFGKPLTGTFKGLHVQEAIKEALEHYAHELDTTQNEIEILEVSLVDSNNK